MRLIDFFIPSITYVLERESDLTLSSSLLVEQVRAFFEHEREIQLAAAKAVGYSEETFERALFAVAALVDEKILSSSWSEKETWAREQLQCLWFDTSNGGVEFFERLDGLNPYHPTDMEIKEVYFFCLAMGFRGRYFEEGQQAVLDQIVAAAGQNLQESLDTGGRLFPLAYQEKPPVELVLKTRFNWLPVLVGVPLIGIILLYYYYRYDILSFSEQILRSI